MDLQKAIDYYEGNKSELARAAGTSRQNINQWEKDGKSIVPALYAVRLQLLTGGELELKSEDY